MWKQIGVLLGLCAALWLGCEPAPERAPDASDPDTAAHTSGLDGVAAGEAGAPRAGVAEAGVADTVDAMRALLSPASRLPLGLSYEQVRARRPSVGPQASDGPGGLTEARTSARAFGRNVRLELNFLEDILYSYYYRLEPLHCDSAAVYFDRLRAAYDPVFEGGRTEEESEGGYVRRTRYWATDAFDVSATLGQQGGGCRLAWGVQE